MAAMQQLPLGTSRADDYTRAIMRLPEEQRLICCLVYFERISLNEIASLLDRPEPSVAEIFYLAHANVARTLGHPAPALAA
jgi:DNA-directed RNA polymerase specialized sigma24 family protein